MVNSALLTNADWELLATTLLAALLGGYLGGILGVGLGAILGFAGGAIISNRRSRFGRAGWRAKHCLPCYGLRLVGAAVFGHLLGMKVDHPLIVTSCVLILAWMIGTYIPWRTAP